MQIRLFGEFSVVSDGVPIRAVDHARLQSLLAYLILHHAAPPLRTQVAFTLWPDTDDRQAQTNLRNTLFRLRQALPALDAHLLIVRERLGWQANAPADVDLIAFDRALTAAAAARQRADVTGEAEALTEAIGGYRGEFLPGHYEEWVLSARDRYQQRLLQALQRRFDLAEQAGDREAAWEYGRQILRHDPLHEETYQRLMQQAHAAGQRASALRLFHQCSSHLRRELDVEPSVQTRAIYREVLQDDGTGHASLSLSSSQASQIIGRQAERDASAAILAKVAGFEAAPPVLLVSGEAGIGKTRLAEAILAWSAARRFTILAARCFRSERTAFAPVSTWLRKASLQELESYLLTELARLLPELSTTHGAQQAKPVPERWQQQRFFSAIVAALLHQPTPLLLLLDDVQWVDPETVATLSQLLYKRGQQRVALLLTLRSEEVPMSGALTDFLAEQTRHGQITQFALQPLNRDESAALAATVRGSPLNPQEATALYEFSEGNPLFIVEAMRAGMDLSVAEGPDMTPSSAVLPPKIEAVLHTRLAALSPPARTVAQNAAAVGRSFDYGVLSRICDQEEVTLLRGLDELWHRQIIAARPEREDHYDFSHERLRHAAYGTFSPMRRKVVHHRIAQALIELHGEEPTESSGRIAQHYALAGEEESAARFHWQAARYAARQFAHEEVVWHCQHGLALLADAPSAGAVRLLRGQLHATLGRAYALAAHQEEAQAAFSSALACTDAPLERVDLLRSAADVAVAGTHFAAAAPQYRQALLELDAVPTHQRDGQWWQAWLDVHQSKAAMFYYQSQLDKLATVLGKIEAAIRRFGTPRQKADYFGALTQLLMRRTRYAGDPELFTTVSEALRWAEASGDEFKIALHRFGYGFVLMLSDKLEEALASLQLAYASTTRMGNTPVRNQILIYMLLTLRRLGHVDAVCEQIDESLDLAHRLGSPMYIGAAHGNAAWLAYRKADAAAAEQHGRAAMEAWSDAAYPFKWIGLLPLLTALRGEANWPVAQRAAAAMLAPDQQVLPEPLSAALAAVAAAGEQPEALADRLDAVVQLATNFGYL